MAASCKQPVGEFNTANGNEGPDAQELSESDISIDSDFDKYESEHEDAGPEVSENEWTMRFTPITIEKFTKRSGPNLPEGFDVTTASPLDYFLLLFNSDLFSTMARYTNSYALYQITQRNGPDPNWQDTTPDEMQAMIGMEIVMGINQLPDSMMYWSQNPFIGNAGLQKVMTTHRYMKLKQYFHVSDRLAEPGRYQPDYDRLYKVRPILAQVSASFLEMYDLGRDVSIDSSMVRYTGELSFGQVMMDKPVKRGIKVWMACDSTTGYLSRFQVCQSGFSSGADFDVVSSLTDNLRGTKRHIYFDKYFTSIPLLKHLLDNGLYACGTVRINRKGFPHDLKKPKMVRNRGEFVVMQKGSSNLTATAWNEHGLVHLLSTLDSPEEIRYSQRSVDPGSQQLIEPSCVASFNKYIGGVELFDQRRRCYNIGRNSKKWWRYLFWFLVNSAVVNAFILYKLTSQRNTKRKRYKHLDFRIELATALISGYCSRKRKVPEMDTFGMLGPEQLSDHISGRLDRRGRCRYHGKHLGKRKETIFGCLICQVHLCRDGCHNKFHDL